MVCLEHNCRAYCIINTQENDVTNEFKIFTTNKEDSEKLQYLFLDLLEILIKESDSCICN